MNNSTESDFLEFLQNFQITYLPENGILVKSQRFLIKTFYTQTMLQSNPKREIPNFEKRRIREKELMVQSRGLVCRGLVCYIDYVPLVTLYTV